MQDTEKQLIVLEKSSALEVFTTTSKLEQLINEVKRQVESLVADVDTAEGRKDIASLAYQVARTKTYLDGIGKDLVTEYKELPKRIDAGRKYARDTLDGLKDQVRQPLDEWEAKQKRIEIGVAIFNCWDEAHEMNKAFNAAKIAEAAAKEQARLEYEAKLKAEAIKEAEAKALAAAQAKELEHQKQLQQKEFEAKSLLEQERLKAERERIAAEKAKAQAELEVQQRKRIAELEQQQRETDLKHRAEVQQSAVMSLGMVVGIDFATAEKIVAAIDKGLVDNISLKY